MSRHCCLRSYTVVIPCFTQAIETIALYRVSTRAGSGLELTLNRTDTRDHTLQALRRARRWWRWLEADGDAAIDIGGSKVIGIPQLAGADGAIASGVID